MVVELTVWLVEVKVGSTVETMVEKKDDCLAEKSVVDSVETLAAY